ncbi:MAG: choice-of-anchor C family protein [Burkholderiales bacterium]
MTKRLVAALFALTCATTAMAAPFQNGGFEVGTLSPDPCNGALPAGSTAITGWTVVAGNIDYVTSCAWQPSEGSRSLDLVGDGSVGAIAQTFDTVAGVTYRVTFDLAGNPSLLFPPAVKPLTLLVPGATYNFGFDISGHDGLAMGWTTKSVTFVATGPSSTITFRSDVAPSGYAGAALDNVRVTPMYPPGTTWTGAAGVVTNTGDGGVPYPVPGSGGTPIDSAPTVASDGTYAPAVFTYATVNSFCCHTGTWTFQTAAAVAGPVTLDWAYSGYHGTCGAYAKLDAFVSRSGTIVYSAPLYFAADDCTFQPPAGGFAQLGQVTLPNVQPGDVYGFTMAASNYDSNGGVSGRLEVSSPVAVAPTLAAPVLIRALPAGSQLGPFLIGRVDRAVNLPVTVRLYGGTSCNAGVLGGTVAPIGTDVTVTTDANGYFATNQAGAQGQFVAVGVVGPQVTPLSACAVSAADNDTWPKALRLVGDSASASDWIDAAGKARWYKFTVLPGQSVQVTLSALPADYDLAVFKDIGAEFVSELAPANTAQLTRLSAQYAPSAFSPSAFSPSAFSPSAFSPSAFSPSAFSPSAFSPSAFSPSAFSPSAFSPSAFSPSAFSPSAFSPSAFSPSAFSPSAFSPSAFSPSAFSSDELAQAFSSAQTRSIIATSMTPGTGNESVVVNSWNNSGDFYVRVTGRAGAFSPSQYNIAVAKQGTTCAAVTDTAISTTRTADPGGYGTVVLVDSGKTPLTAAVAGGSLGSKLTAFMQRTEVKGVLVDVATDARVNALKAQAAANLACPYAKNLVAAEIKSIVDAYLATNPLRYIVIVGNDDAIPFFRHPDQTLLGQESGYVPPVSSSSASEASLRNNYVLGQDAYGAPTQISLGVGDFPIPGVAVGRLVETPAEIAGMIDAYVAANGVVAPASSLVTGYDFLQDVADAVRTELQAGTGRTPDALITPATVSPADTRTFAQGGPWTANDLRPRLLNTRHDVVFLAGHFNANSALAADFTTSLVTSELAASTLFTNALVFSAGCHAGYNIVDSDAINGVTFPLDWAQAFARAKATLVAGTGYQYGDTDFIEYSERLYLNFAKQLRAGSGPVAVGTALVKAKLDYLAATPDIRGLHAKAVLEATLFGLPMMSVNMPAGRTPATGGVGVIATTPAPPATPAGALGLQTAELSVAPVLTTRTATLRNYDVVPNTTSTATWLTGPDGIVTNPAEPALPLQVVDVTPIEGSLVLRGVGLRGGTYADQSVLPLTGAPATELRGVHTPFSSPHFFPMRLWTTNYFDTLAGGARTSLLVTPAQHRALDATNSTLRSYSGLSLRLFYSDLTKAARPQYAAAALSDAPTILRVDSAASGTGVTFTVQVVGDPAAAIHQVWLTYTSGAGGAGTWTSLDLAQCVIPLPAACGGTQDSRLWKAKVPAASLPADARYIVQAVSGAGLVALDDNLGRYYTVGTSAPPAATTIAFAPPVPAAAVYGSSATVTANLAAGGTALAGKLVTIGAGGTSRTGTTNGQGAVTIALPMLAAPGSYPLVASFAGDAAYLPASASAGPVTVTKATATLARPASGVGAVLTASVGGKAQPLIQETVKFLIKGPQGTQQVYVATDYTGRAAIPPPGSPAGNYSVTQACFAGNALYTSAMLNASPSCDYQFAGFFPPVSNPPSVNSVNSGQSIPVKFSLGGDRGSAVLAAGSPASQVANCATFAPTGPLEPLSPELEVDDGGQYKFNWKTDKSWKGTCRVLVLTLNDGSVYRANFNFAK